MNKNKQEIGDDYRQLQIKIFARTAVLMFVAIVIVWCIYNSLIHGRFADAVVRLLENYVYGDYDTALQIYQLVFRNNKIFLLMIAVLLIFWIVLWIYLAGFTEYFIEINRGIDALIEENTGDIVLPSELAATEKKINSIKHTLEQRKMAAEIAEQRKNNLVVYLAHDLKTPLTSVIGYLTLLRDENQISEELREKYLSISLDKAERLEDLINEFFEITRFNLSNITLEYSQVNLTRLLEQLTYEFKPILSEKNLECALQIAPNVMIRCDVDKMQRVFDNLLRNAVNYSFDNTKIRITAVQEDHNIRITFTNNGNTIPEEKLNRIFEQFYRLDTARSSRNGGAGLGLAIAKEIITLHGGAITARSEKEIIEFEVVVPLS